MKKGLTIVTLTGLAISVLLLILSVLGSSFLAAERLNLLITSATITAGGFFAITSVNLLNYNKKIAYVSLSLISLSVLLIIIQTWSTTLGDIYSYITFTVAILSVLFNTISSTVLKLQKRYLAVQIIVYILQIIFIMITLLLIYGVLKFDGVFELFLVALILSLAGVIVLAVLSRKNVVGNNDDQLVKISKQEYLLLLEKAKKYDEMVK